MSFVTTGQMAEQLGVDRDRVCYLLRKAKIRPVARAGLTRLYPPETLAIVKRLEKSPRLDTAKIEAIMSRFPAIAV